MPRTLNNSAVVGGSLTVSPLPGSRDASPLTQISFVGASAAQLRVLSVVGSRTGSHPGRLAAYSQGDGASFLPSRPFAAGERVTVRARLRRGARSVTFADSFAIEQRDPLDNSPEASQPVGSAGVQSFRSRPDLQPPAVTVTANSPAVAPGEVFLSPYSGPGQAGPMILGPSGALVWFKPLPPRVGATNLQVQRYLGQPVLTWWEGNISVHGFGLGQGVIADGTYKVIAYVHAGNGYQADLHELQLTPRGTAWITAYDPEMCNLTAVGGGASSAVTNGVVQEVDIRTGLVRFQWAALDHVPLADSYELARKGRAAWPFDFFHVNSIDEEEDGSLLVSGRNTWATYRLDPRTGKITWQLGGKHSSFKLGAGAATAWQHDSRLLPDGSISIFDNGSSPTVHQQSRGVVLQPNQGGAIALRGQITHPSPIVAESQGNMQALANGDWFVGWGQVADLSEFSPAGQLLFDAHLPAHVQSYRDFRFAWDATPAQPPDFVVLPAGGGAATVYASWNGATRLAAWRVLAGPGPGALGPVAQVASSGFETSISLPPESAGPYVTVQALDVSGAVLGTAAAKPVTG